MKIRRLSEMDLARFCALPRGERLDQELRLYSAGGGAWSYDPVRRSTSDIANAQTPLLGPSLHVPWENIAAQIARACNRGEAQRNSNQEVGKVLYDHVAEAGWAAVKVLMGRMPIGFGDSVSYWSDLVVDDGDGPFISYFDHRREHGVTNEAIRQIVFSMQNVWVRERNLDLSDARLAVVRFPVNRREKTRTVHIDFAKEADLLSYDELDSRVRYVYETWARILDERQADRKTGTGGSNPFDF